MKCKPTIRCMAALLPLLILCSCGKTPTETSEPSSAVSDTSQNDDFVPDYAPGEEVTHSMYYDALAAQQGNWLYYGIKSGKGGWDSGGHTHAIVKTQLGKTAEDRVVVMTRTDMRNKFSLTCLHCGKNTAASGSYMGIIGTLGDWIYMRVDQHVLRLRTDGELMESVLCREPDDQIKNTELVIRDNKLYYLSEERRPVSASQTEDTRTIRKLDLVGGETRDVATVPVAVEMGGWCGNDIILLDYEIRDHCNAYILGTDDSVTLCEKWNFTYDKNYFANFRILQGCTGEDMLVSGGLIMSTLNGIYRMNQNDLKGFAKKSCHVPKTGEKISESGYAYPVYDISPLSDFLLPGTADFTVKDGCTADGGFFFTTVGADEGLYYYSHADKALRRLNGDEAQNLLWPGDGYLYYVCTTKTGGGFFNGTYRIRPDGTGWEDVSWMVAPVN